MSSSTRRCNNTRCKNYHVAATDTATLPNMSGSASSETWKGYGECYDCSQENDEFPEASAEEVYQSRAPMPSASEAQASTEKQHPLPLRIHSKCETPIVVQDEDKQDALGMQALLLCRLYGATVVGFAVWAMSVVVALDAAGVLYHYIQDGENTRGGTQHQPPSTAALAAACLLYALTTAAHAYAQRANRYQAYFYQASVGGLALTAWVYGWPAAAAILPADVVVTHVLSAAFHAVCPEKESARREQQRWYTPVVVRDRDAKGPLLPR